MRYQTRIGAFVAAGLIGCATAATAVAAIPGPSTDARQAHAQAVPTTVPSPTTPVPPSTVKPLPAPARGPLDKAKARVIVKTVIERPVAPLRGPADVQTIFGTLTTGAFLVELKAEQGELQEYGWTVRGTPTIATLDIVSLRGKRASASVCIDQSSVTVVDATGRPVGPSAVLRARHLFDFTQQPDGSWVISARRFPNNPTC